MDTIMAFKMGRMFCGNKRKVFDWNKAAFIMKREKAVDARAGLLEDWEWTGGYILIDGKPTVDDYTYLASTWATPVLIIDLKKPIECWCWEDEHKWNEYTKWPRSSLEFFKKVD